MAQCPVLIFDKSTPESLNRDEAVVLDNFYASNITERLSVKSFKRSDGKIKTGSTNLRFRAKQLH